MADPIVPDDAVAAIPSRRRFFAASAGAVAALAGASSLAGQSVGLRGKPLPTPVGSTIDPSADWKDPVLRLVRRITMGVEPTEVALARQLGYYGYLEYQLNASAIDDSAVSSYVATTMPMLSQTAAQLKAAATAANDNGNEAVSQLRDATLYRAVFSRRQLQERMVEFWTDHFNIATSKVTYLKLPDDRDVIRPYALGKFPDMLRASATSAAMLFYLDQNTSRTPTPNQNYAREIMELHTLGVDGGYTQDDVAQLSRILTGWSFDTNGAFTFVTGSHDRTAKLFMGVTYAAMAATATAAQQRAEGDAAITQLVNHPNTARYLATKMARWLLAYEPPAAVIDATAAAYLATGGDIKAMIRTILTPKNLMASPAKLKRPFHFATSFMRATATEVYAARPPRQAMDAMSQMSFNWEQPDGYPDRVEWWSGLITQRWSYAQNFANANSTTTVRVNTVTRFRAPVDTAEGVVNQINLRLFGGEAPTGLKAALLTYLKAGTYSDARVRETLALAASSTQFQWY